jgi:hypothetical protein
MNGTVSLTFIRATTCHIRHSRQKNNNKPASSIANLDDEGSLRAMSRLAPSMHYYSTYLKKHTTNKKCLIQCFPLVSWTNVFKKALPIVLHVLHQEEWKALSLASIKRFAKAVNCKIGSILRE